MMATFLSAEEMNKDVVSVPPESDGTWLEGLVEGLRQGRAQGVAEGRRLERRALKHYLDSEPYSQETETRLWLQYVRPAQLKKQRTKPAKRKEANHAK